MPVMELVRTAGIDVSDWVNTTGKVSSNLKYCYEWAFKQDKTVVLLNLWHEHMRVSEGSMMHDLLWKSQTSRFDVPASG
jgi:hypothetical protein